MFKNHNKEVIDFDKEVMKKQILEKYERNNQNKYYKWALIPVGLFIAFIGIIAIQNNSFFSTFRQKSSPNKESNINININQIKEMTISDIDIKIVTNDVNMLWPDILMGGINLPQDLNKNSTSIIYTKDQETKNYTHLNSYVYNYFNDSLDRNIELSFSSTDKPIRDHYFIENAQKSIINNYELLIYAYNQTYFAEFTYKGFNFNIETQNITQEELISLLESIIK